MKSTQHFYFFTLIIFTVIFSTRVHSGNPISNTEENAEYYFLHNDVATITNYIIVDGKEMGIKFHPKSNKERLEALNALSTSVYLTNANGTHIILFGKLYNTMLKTSTGISRLESEQL